MTPESDWVKLVVGLQNTRNTKWVMALRSTADHYGWTEEFEPWRPGDARLQGGVVTFQDPGRRGRPGAGGGTTLRISRSPDRDGYAAGMVNRFRVSCRVGLADLAELAHFTKGDWHWMEKLGGGRLTRDEWEAIYQAAK